MDRPLLFGKFCLLERISVGGMAEVFRAKPLNAPDPDRYFAVKRILPHLAEDVEFIKMFVDEARLTVQFDHPNIVHTYELGQFQTSHYIVMEFIAGKDLLAFQKLVRRRETVLSVELACHIMREVAQGLDYAHRKTDENGQPLGIIHRDISPQNILVSWDGRVRVIDFGIAKATSQSTKTQAGVMKGKFGYLSPEQVRAKKIDHRSDIFAMGTLFWELLTNQRLFNASSQYETMMLIGDPDVEPPSSVNPQIPPEVDAIALKALAAERDDRYQWGSELAQDLDRFLKNQKPPYHDSQLTSWLRSAFEEDFEEEKQKREKFRSINSAEDVRRQFDEEYGKGGDDADQQVHDATEIWDVDVAPDTDVNLEEFVANHTVVAAGGLDLDDYDEWADAPDTVEEIVGPPGLPGGGAGAARGIEIAAESEYDGAPTVVTDPSLSPLNMGSIESPSSPGGSIDDLPLVDPAALTPEPTPPQGLRARANDAPTGEQDRLVARVDNSPTGEHDDFRSAPTPPQGVRADTSTTGSQAMPAGAARSGGGLVGALTDKRVLGALAAVAAVSILAAVTVVVVLSDDEEQDVVETPQFGALVVDAEPATGLEIFVDGDLRGTQAPLPIDQLDPGSYRIEIDHPDYLAWSGEAVVEEGEVTALDADLRAAATLVLRWEKNPENMQLFLDGTAVEITEEGELKIEELRRGSYLVEAVADGVRPVRKAVVVESGEENAYQLHWTLSDELTITGDEDVELALAGETKGSLPVSLSGVEVGELLALELGDVAVVLGYPELGMAKIDVDTLRQLAGRSEDDYGRVILDVETDDWWQLVIDDVETGVLIPLHAEIPVAAGNRTFGFQRGDRRYEFAVPVVEGEVSRLTISLQPPEPRALLD